MDGGGYGHAVLILRLAVFCCGTDFRLSSVPSERRGRRIYVRRAVPGRPHWINRIGE